MAEQEKKTVEQRREILHRQIDLYTRQGYRVVSQTDTSVQLVKPKKFSIIWGLLWLMFLVVGLLFYILYYALIKRDKQIYITIDEYGHVNRR